jgi:hypothetical protein
MARIALVSFGYNQFASPLSLLEKLGNLRPVGHEYKSGVGYVYFYAEEDGDVIDIKIIEENQIHADKNAALAKIGSGPSPSAPAATHSTLVIEDPEPTATTPAEDATLSVVHACQHPD